MQVTLNEEMCEELFRKILKVDFEEHCAWMKDFAWRKENKIDDTFYSEEDEEYDRKLHEAYKTILAHYYTELEAQEIIEGADNEIAKYFDDRFDNRLDNLGLQQDK